MTEPSTTPPENARFSSRPLLVAGGFLFLALLGIRSIANATLWCHLATGRFIAQQGIPRADVWSFTAEGNPWVAETWLYDRLLYALWGMGAPVVILIHVALVLVAFGLMLGVARRWAGGASIALGLALSGWLLAPQFAVHPVVAALVFISVIVFALSRPLPSAALWTVVLGVQVLWTNMHPSFVFGPIICLVFAVEASRRSARDDDLDEPEDRLLGVRTTWFLAAAAALATLLNPYGPMLHLHLVGHLNLNLTDPTFLFYREWISPFSGQFQSLAAKHSVNLGLVAGACGLLTYRRKLPLALTTLAVVGAVAAVLNGLSVYLFSMLAFPFFCLSFQSLGQFIFRRAGGSGEGTGSWDRAPAPILATLVVVLSLGAVVSNQYYRSVGSGAAFGLGVSEGMFPEEADAIIGRPDFPALSINLIGDGGFLVWKYPDRKWFIDQRPGVYEEDQYRLLINARSGDEAALREIIESWGVEAVIVSGVWPGAGAMLRNVLSLPGWALAYLDGTTAVAVIKSPAYAGLIGNAEIQQHGLDVLEEERRAYRERIAGVFGAPISPRLIGAGSFFYSLGAYPAAYAAYDLITLNAPCMRSAWLPLGISQLRLGAGDAIRSLVRACELYPHDALAWMALGEAYAAEGQAEKAEEAHNRALALQPVSSILDGER